jgi:SAM-dependent methyltransferase
VAETEDHQRELDDNRKLWDAWTEIHTTGEFYDVQHFRDDPNDVRIPAWEREEVGDVSGKSLLHLQCHFGLDTLSWARLGAAQVAGLDFSEPAVGFARELATEVGLSDRARFVASNVYDAPAALGGETFDVVYTSRGVLSWLPDIERWADVVSACLAPGGTFFINEAHPVLWTVAEEQQTPNDLHLAFGYWGGATYTFPVQGSYADPEADVDAEVEHGWNHSLGEMITALVRGGLHLEYLDEKPRVYWPMPWLVEREPGAWGFPADQEGTLPLTFSLRARKDA